MLLKAKKNKECQARIYLFPSKTFIQIMYVYIVRSSDVNEVIRAVLNYFFFLRFLKILHAPKSPKAQRRNQAKAQNTTSEQ